jgi:hypothetical protein
MMDDHKLRQSLNSIGKACFVKYYELFRNKSSTEIWFVVDFLMRAEHITEAGAKIRVGFARGIFNAGRQNDALKIVAQSERVPRDLAEKAKLLLNGGTVSLSPSCSSLPPSRLTAKPPRTASWPEWDLPDQEDLVQLAKLTTPYIRFLHPDIVRFIVADNQLHRERWGARLTEHGVDPSLYLWEDSPCAFPGVRRYAGSAEIAHHRKKAAGTARPANAIALDDNSYPKQIWSFVFLGKRFPNHGPVDYSLAHLVDHKNYKNRVHGEFDILGNNTQNQIPTYFGLYTSPTNAVYMPIGLMRPTDFSFPLRNLIQRKAYAIYGNLCKILPPHLSIRVGESDVWSLDSFDWREPVGTSEHLPAFLEYRNKHMEGLLSSRVVARPF